MKIRNLNPDQIITLGDYPVRSEQILKLYFRMHKKGTRKLVPPCPVIHKRFVKFRGRLKEKFDKFCEDHPAAEYFLVDGSHKTTAATLASKQIYAMVFNSNEDIREAKRLVKKGELISLATDDSIEASVKSLIKHFKKYKKFETVKEKTMRLVRDKKVPEYMIKKRKK
jgi:hypothetical protein